ncbi:HTTM domain-containing protein [Streptomyces sp. NPDC052077]|uniref:HTTM domain-containing protein n=1 Tax=Streptomyces sp. NPDC052077 TaxID=3154757 RepID=UPI00342CC7E0
MNPARPLRSVRDALARVTGTALGPHQSAVIRIGFSLTWLLFLLREIPHRHELYGPDGPWSHELAQRLIAENGAFTVLMWSDGRFWFEAVYALSVLASVGLLLGWRTRTLSVLFMVGVLSLQNRSIFMGDGGDNVLHLMSVYLVLTRCGRVWSLDARRERREAAARARGEWPVDRTGPALWGVLGAVLVAASPLGGMDGDRVIPVLLWAVWLGTALWWWAGHRARDGGARALLDVLANILHNAGLVVIMAEACLVYATAGWYKIQGSRWQDGTAVHYPLQLQYFSPWPALSEALAASGTMVLLMTYGTVAVQVAFPFTLFNRRLKNVLLAAMIAEHAAIAVMLGLPFFSLAMIAADAVFLPTSFLRRLGAWAARVRDRFAGRRGPRARDGDPGGDGGPDGGPSRHPGGHGAPEQAPPGHPDGTGGDGTGGTGGDRDGTGGCPDGAGGRPAVPAPRGRAEEDGGPPRVGFPA